MKSVFEQSVKQAVAAIATLLVAGSVFAQNYPSKPVTLLVPYPAGGLSDVIARTVNNTLSKNLGQPVIVDNLGGASGAIAAQKVFAYFGPRGRRGGERGRR
jgi:tripartite-type tricarboxylate transporter receptor subunit TctC